MNKHACFTRRLVEWCGLLTLIVFSAIPLFAQEGDRSQLNLQATYPLQLSNTAMDSSGAPLTNNPTSSAGFLLGYGFKINNWFRIEADYGASRNSQRFNGASGLTELQGDMHQLTTGLEVTVPIHFTKFLPYGIVETGAVRFAPTDFTKGIVVGADSQSKAAFVYGGGVNYGLTHNFGVRAEYRRLITKSPNYDVPGLGPTGTLQISEPSVGLYVRDSETG